MSRQNPSPAELIAWHKWDWRRSRPPNQHVSACTSCGWEGDTRNTGKTALILHAEHVCDLLGMDPAQ
jgi:hypothetical protein